MCPLLKGEGGEVDLCVKDPGKEVDVYFTTKVKTMTEVWMRATICREAVASDKPKIVGPEVLLRGIGAWSAGGIFAGTAPASEI